MFIRMRLCTLLPQQHEDVVNSLAYEADARVKDLVYGCVGAISVLQQQIAQLQQELTIAHSDLARIPYFTNNEKQCTNKEKAMYIQRHVHLMPTVSRKALTRQAERIAKQFDQYENFLNKDYSANVIFVCSCFTQTTKGCSCYAFHSLRDLLLGP